ncbi:hypothetical protein IQ269_16710 [Tychonema sp. LEGE 07199]|nr:hypothetical protein [Tychonema sp. LEGE 07196]MBE9122396.1 hypothetical protein [Tychonema sp. LEGE 07199]MBE9133939.1 hypothetical protein [Tychonema sp. LEGE 07196]
MSFYRLLLSALILVTINFTSSTSIALAETKERYLSLDSDASQSFANLVQQAEDLAALSIARQLQTNPGLTVVTVIVTATRRRQLHQFHKVALILPPNAPKASGWLRLHP